MQSPNIVHLTIEAANGPRSVSEALGLHISSVHAWARKKDIPSKYIVKVCEMGRNTFTPHQVLEYMEQARKEKESA